MKTTLIEKQNPLREQLETMTPEEAYERILNDNLFRIFFLGECLEVCKKLTPDKDPKESLFRLFGITQRQEEN
jgi:recombinational DNA repair protein (RecF pathway)